MGLLTIQSKSRITELRDLRTSNVQIRTSNNELRITQYQYTI